MSDAWPAGRDPRSTRVLWVSTGLLFTAWIVNYVDRLAISVALPAIGSEFHLHKTELGLIVSAFFFTYMLSQFPGGLLADRVGARPVILLAVVTWSLFTGLTGLVTAFGALLVVRILFGVTEGMFPTASVKAISERTTPGNRGRALGAMLASNNLGAALAPLLMAPAFAAIGWHAGFGVLAAVGLVMAVILGRFLPRPLARPAGPTLPEAPAAPRVSPLLLLRSGAMWRFAALFATSNMLAYGLLTWAPSYLMDKKHVSLRAVGVLASIPWFGALIGMVLGGFLLDRYFAHRARRLMVPAIVIGGAFLVPMIQASTAVGFTVWMTLVNMISSLATLAMIGLPIKVLPPAVSGSATGLLNFGGQLGGAVTPLIMGWLVDAYSYPAGFTFLIVATAVCAVLALFVPQTRAQFARSAPPALLPEPDPPFGEMRSFERMFERSGRVAGMATSDLADQLCRTRRFGRGEPDRFTVTPDGGTVLFLRTRSVGDGVTCLWALDVGTGEERPLVEPAAAPGVTGYAVDRDARVAACTMGGELWLVGVDGGPAVRLPVAGPVADPRPDPAGRRVGYLAGHALRVVGADGGGDRAVATPDGPDVRFGAAPHTGDGRGYWWSPDGERLLVARVDESAVERWHLTDLLDPAAAPRTVRHPTVGTANPDVTLWIVGPDDGWTAVRWDHDGFEYLVGAGWDIRGPYAVVQSRDQRTVRFLGVDAATGGTRTLAEQRDAGWVQLVPGLPARTAGGILLGHADRAGTRHLTVDGAAVTPSGLQLREVLAVDGEEVLFAASEEPTEVHLWRWRAADGPRRLSGTPGVHTGTGRGGTLVHVARGTDRPGGRVTVSRDGAPSVRIESHVEPPVLAARAVRMVLGPRELRAALYLPSWHRAGGAPLPMLVDVYGGASRQRVTAEVDWRCLMSQWFAEQGFAVLVADGSGTPGRGPAWEREVHGDLYGPVLADQVTAVREAARTRPELDPGRVGIRGSSFGGSVATLAVLRHPEVFHAAVATAAVSDQRLYNAHWRERFLGHPDEHPERYDVAPVREAAGLSRPLLLVHGLADERVHPAHTLRLSAALLAAGRDHETLLLPGVGHQTIGVPATGNLLRHQARFLHRHLGGHVGRPAGG